MTAPFSGKRLTWGSVETMNRNEVGLARKTAAIASSKLSIAHDVDTPAIAGVSSLPCYASMADMVRDLKPSRPVHCLHPEKIRDAAVAFVTGFRGTPLYAVKCNPDPQVLKHLYLGGLRHFDVASIAEIALIRGLFPAAHLAYMHPVKSRESIREAYYTHAVRDFSIDTFEELHKILEETGSATDLAIHVRLALPKGSAAHDLSGKFGIDADGAVQLLQDVRKVAAKVGLCFHVGSQCMDPDSYRVALSRAADVLARADIQLDVLDVGGGFPVTYPDMAPPPLADYFRAIEDGIAGLNLPESCEIWCEPGRALVASGETVVVRVELRKGDALYINDGSYGSLLDAGFFALRYPVSLLRPGRKVGRDTAPFRFYGPTCDSADHMKGPFILPADVREGDWIAIGQHGAYGTSLQSRFNGFHSDHMVEISGPARTRPRKTDITTYGVVEQ
jgi:ornithine decarboxylase